MLHITNVLKGSRVSQPQCTDFLHSSHALPFNMTLAHTTTQGN